MDRRMWTLLMVMILSLLLGTSCTTKHFGVTYRAILAPSDFDRTEAAIAQAEKSEGAKYCPEKIAKAKELGKKAIETYLACRTGEAMMILAEARKLAKEAESCQPPPRPPAPPAPPAPTPPPPVTRPAPMPVFDTVYFDPNKTNISPAAARALDQNGKLLKENPQIKVEIGGHTDPVGSEKANQVLSEKRAQSAKKYLMDKFNIAENRLMVKGYGATKPIADNRTEEGRSKNRRVEIRILP